MDNADIRKAPGEAQEAQAQRKGIEPQKTLELKENNTPIFGDPTWIARAAALKQSRHKAGRRRGQPWAEIRGRHPIRDPKTGELGIPWTCKSCKHLMVKRMAKNYHKCAKAPITAGPGTDIRVSDPACILFEKRHTK